jgi:cytochrome c-type biogenesis protein CcmH/NrfF
MARMISQARSVGARHCRALSRAIAISAFALTLFSVPVRAQQTDQAKSVGHRMFCMCGCKQILTECNHVGCTMSTKMLKQLDAEVASGKSDDLILQSFVQDFGGTVIAEPPTKGFNLLGWLMPFIAIGGGLFLVRGILARWSQPAPAMPGGPSLPPETVARIRRDTEQDD